jgi:dTDP-4-dehydrorhamnose reductase
MDTKASGTLILGGGGFLGRYFAKVLGESSIIHTRVADLRQPNLVPFNLGSERDLNQLFNELDFSTVINCLGLASIEECEKNPELANWVNTEIPALVAKYSLSKGIDNLYISTDAVLSSRIGKKKENSSTFTGSIYSRTKLAGELETMANNPNSLIARVNFYGVSPRNASLFEYFYNGIKAGRQTAGFENVFFTTMYAEDTAEACVKLIKTGSSGIFHVVGSERISKFEFGSIIAEQMSRKNLVLSKQADEKFLHLRSKDLALDNEKMKAVLGQPPILTTGIQRAISENEKREENVC